MLKKIIYFSLLCCFITAAHADECKPQYLFSTEAAPIEMCLHFSMWSEDSEEIDPYVWGYFRYNKATCSFPRASLREDIIEIECEKMFTVRIATNQLEFGYNNWFDTKLRYSKELQLPQIMAKYGYAFEDIFIGNIDTTLSIQINEVQEQYRLSEVYPSPFHLFGAPIQRLNTSVVHEIKSVTP